MIVPTKEDIGRRVLHRTRPDSKPEVGFVTALVWRSKVPAVRVALEAGPAEPRVLYCESLEWDGERWSDTQERLDAQKPGPLPLSRRDL